MAISLRREKDEQGGDCISVKINNGHIDALENIVKKYNPIHNEAQALDFILKAIGKDDNVSSSVVVDGVSYTPANYGDK